jgi:hypothetical protein
MKALELLLYIGLAVVGYFFGEIVRKIIHRKKHGGVRRRF